MRGTLAVAWLSLVGIMRQGMVWVIAAESGIVLLAAFAVPVIQEEHHAARLRLLLFAAVECALLLSVLVAAFGVATAIPSDQTSRRLYLVLTRPCSRAGMVVGRFAGAAAALGILHGCAWLILIIAIMVGGWRGEISQAQTVVDVPVHAASMEASGGGVVLQDAGDEDPTYLLSASGDTVVFSFSGLPRPGDGGVARELVLDFGAGYSSRHGPLRSTEVEIASAGSSESPRRVRMRFRKPLTIEAIPAAIDEAGRLQVSVTRLDDRFDLYVRADRAMIRVARTSVVWNLARALAIAWLGTLPVLAMAVLASTLFSEPVAILFTLFLVLCGQIAGFLDRYAESVIDQAALAAELGLQADDDDHEEDDHHRHGFEPPSATAVALARAGRRLTVLVPHLEDFDQRSNLVSGLQVPSRRIAKLSLVAALYSLAYLTLASVAFRRRSAA